METSISTPAEQKEKWGGNCGANAAVMRKTGKKLFGAELSDTIVFLPHWRDDKDNAEQIANANLIAAAPDLLEALKQAEVNLDHLIEDKGMAELNGIRFTIHQAINKATCAN